MGNDNYKKFESLMDSLKELYEKVTKNKIYNINESINKIKINLNDCKNLVNQFLYTSSYTPGSLIDKDLDECIAKIINWKKNIHRNYRNYFEQAKQLLNDIQKRENQINNVSMDIETNEYTNNSSYQGQPRSQVMVSRQEVAQAQELALLNDNLGRALASLECYANRCSGKKLTNIFDYYNMFNLGNTQNLEELRKKAFIQTQIFKLAYDDYINKYKYYTKPENIKINEIINYLNFWMYNVPEDQKILYQGMINILSLLNNSEFEKKFQTYSEKYKNAKMDPKKIASFAPGIYYYNYKRSEEAKNNYLQHGKLTSILHINKNYKNDANAELLFQQISTNQQNQEKAVLYNGDFK